MRVERKHKVLEPNAFSDNDSSEDENYLATTHERETKLLETLKEIIEKNNQNGSFEIQGD